MRLTILRMLSPCIQLLLAVSVYSACRPRSLYLNRAIDMVWDRRYDDWAEYFCSCLPDVVIYSLPAALWLNASLDVFRLLVNSHFKFISRATLGICIASEFAQLSGVISGNFDILDLASYFAAYCFNQLYHGRKKE